jgi:hypothetical protein
MGKRRREELVYPTGHINPLENLSMLQGKNLSLDLSIRFLAFQV